MNNKNGTLILLMLLVAVLFLLAGCGAASKKTEAQIARDIQSDERVLSGRTDITVKDVEIEKRLTSDEDNLDTVWVSFTFDGTDGLSVGEGDCVLYYRLYDEGWLLDEVEPGQLVFKPLQSSDYTEETLLADITAYGYGQDSCSSELTMTGYDTDLENGVDTYTVEMTNQYKYMTETLTLTATYSFEDYGTWYCSNVYENSRTEDWSAIKEVRFKDTDSTKNLRITNFERTDEGAKLSYSYLRRTSGEEWEERTKNDDEFVAVGGYGGMSVMEWVLRTYDKLLDYRDEGYKISLEGEGWDDIRFAGGAFFDFIAKNDTSIVDDIDVDEYSKIVKVTMS